MVTSVLASCTLFFFDDDCTLGEESEAVNHSASGAGEVEGGCYYTEVGRGDPEWWLPGAPQVCPEGSHRAFVEAVTGGKNDGHELSMWRTWPMSCGTAVQEMAGILSGLSPLCVDVLALDPSWCAPDAAADLEAAAAAGQKLEYSWTSLNFLLPAILLFSQSIFGLAAGMTVKCASEQMHRVARKCT